MQPKSILVQQRQISQADLEFMIKEAVAKQNLLQKEQENADKKLAPVHFGYGAKLFNKKGLVNVKKTVGQGHLVRRQK